MSAIEDWEEFTSVVESEGVSITAHSGLDDVSHDPYKVYTVQEWFDHDRIECEEEFSNSYHFDGLVSVEDCLTGAVNLESVEFDQICESVINGQRKQAIKQFNNLDDQSEFIEWLEDHTQQLEIYKLILSEHY